MVCTKSLPAGPSLFMAHQKWPYTPNCLFRDFTIVLGLFGATWLITRDSAREAVGLVMKDMFSSFRSRNSLYLVLRPPFTPDLSGFHLMSSLLAIQFRFPLQVQPCISFATRFVNAWFRPGNLLFAPPASPYNAEIGQA